MTVDKEAVLASPGKLQPRIFDELEHTCFTFENGLKVLLLSDKEAEKAGCAMDVRVGSLSDPDDLPGLAHFTEHMLFFASQKYPKEDEYSKFMTEHGGNTNAYTSAESTNYQFDVNADHLEPALDRFAQFFICPLFSQDGVEREVKAVDSEHGKNVNSDSWRALQLWKHTANRGHPFSKFGTGNLDSLLTKPKAAGVRVHERVREFHRQHYSAGIMALAVYGRQPLAELRALVTEKFGGIASTGVTAPAFADDAVTREQQGRLIRVVPQKEGHALEMQWAIPAQQALYRAAPANYVSHCLGFATDPHLK